MASREAEQNVLGSLLDAGGAQAWARIKHIKLTAADFYQPEHQEIFAAIDSLAVAGRPHDAQVVAEQLRGKVDERRLHKLANENITGTTVAVYARRVRDLAARRALSASDATTAGFVDTDIANAARLARRHGSNLRYTPAGGWLTWLGTHWQEDPKAVRVQALAKATALSIFDEVKDAAERDLLFKHAKRSQAKTAIEAMITLARSEPEILTELTAFDTDLMLFNVANGTIDLRTGELRPHAREDLITRLSPISFDAEAECELWDAFLWRVLGQDEDLYRYARRLVGYLLTGKTSEQVLHFLYGLGANGKSVFCEILEVLLGDYAIVVGPEMVMTRRHSGIPNDIARLRGVRAAFMNETTQGSRFDEAKLKDLTGGDTLTGRFLHQEFFDFPPTHKLIIRGNHKPVISGTDEGIWRRLRLIPFIVTIAPDEQDHELIEKLRGELPGILKWALDGCLEWQREGLKPPAVIVDAVREYREESDTLGRFIAEHCTTDDKLAQVKAGVFFQRYQDFAEQAGERWMPAKELPHEMRRRGFEPKRTKAGALFLGIELNEPSEPSWHDR
jgi:putative DNA primase/helicase